MTKEEILAEARTQLRLAAGWESDQTAVDRAKAIDAYFMRPRGDEGIGRSRVVSGDVSAMVDSNLAQMLDAFSSDDIAEFESYGAADEDQAQLESDTVSHFVMKAGNGFVELGKAIKNALLLRLGIVKVWVEETTSTDTRTFTGVTPEAIAGFPPEAKILKFDPEAGTARTRVTKTQRKFRCEAISNANFLYNKDHDTHDLQDIAFCAERRVSTRSELIKLGFSKATVNALPPFHGTPANKPDEAAARPHKMPVDLRGAGEAQDSIEWYEAYMLIDGDGDGVSERHRVCFVAAGNDGLLSDDIVRLVPYACGVALVNPHQLVGVSDFDKLRQTWDLNTGLKRALMDNVNTTTKNRLAYLDGKVNVDDVSDGRSDGALRVKANVGDVRTAVMPFQIPDTSANIRANIDAVNRERTELGGAALELATGQMQIGGDRMGSQGLDRAYSVMEQLCAMKTKNIAATLIRSVYLLAHAMLRENYTDPVPIKVGGRWAEPIPSKWQPRSGVEIKVGMSPGERSRRAATLMTMLKSQLELAGNGMDDVLVNVENFYKTLMDWARVSGVENPERYFVDPSSDGARRAMQGKQQAAKQQSDMKQQLMTQAVLLERFGVMIEKYKADQETQFKYWKGVLDAEVEEAKIVGAATATLIAAEEIPDDQDGSGKAAGEQPAAA